VLRILGAPRMIAVGPERTTSPGLSQAKHSPIRTAGPHENVPAPINLLDAGRGLRVKRSSVPRPTARLPSNHMLSSGNPPPCTRYLHLIRAGRLLSVLLDSARARIHIRRSSARISATPAKDCAAIPDAHPCRPCGATTTEPEAVLVGTRTLIIYLGPLVTFTADIGRPRRTDDPRLADAIDRHFWAVGCLARPRRSGVCCRLKH